MNIVDLIEKKKRGGAYSENELGFIIESIMKNEIPDYQISAMLMAIYFQGMNIQETTYLTKFMVESGEILDLSHISDNVVDKHSTGGVGDKITLILLPLLAAAGLCSAKLSGRGLGFTGGTIDKLESIPGFNVNLSTEEFLNLVKNNKAAIAAQTTSLTPADGKLYALRDVTSTVDIIPLIASSVISKKIASGANHIILDVKCGEGAFVKNIENARELAKTMVEVGKRLGRNVCALITNMDMPLGRAVGNSIEIIEVIEFLKGNTSGDLAKPTYDLAELTYEMAVIALIKSGRYTEKDAAIRFLKELVKSGEALRAFERIISNQGGDVSVINDYSILPKSTIRHEMKASADGYVTNISAYKIAKACKLLGSGREKKGDPIDYAVGVYLNKKYGEKVTEGETYATIHASCPLTEEILKSVEDAYTFAVEKPPAVSLIYEVIN